MTITKTINVHSHNRLGITNEILSIFKSLNIDLVGLEMETHHTYVQFTISETGALEANEQIDLIKQCILQIEGVNKIEDLEVLPNEARRLHLDVLLSNLPDPIFDIDESGNIIKVNQATITILGLDENEIYTHHINDFFSESLEKILRPAQFSIEVTCLNKSYFAEITPIISNTNGRTSIKGAVILLKRPERLGMTISAVQQNRIQGGTIITESNVMQDILTRAKRFAILELPILITGETGTGKEVLAKSIHEESSRKNSPFLAINCAALPENLLESELFGYSSGAFSGALKSGKPGLFELAHNGTLFLDEIGEMSIYLQAKILRFLQDYTFRRLGSNKEKTVDVRIISATNRKITTLFKTNQFREDLYYRLNVLSLQLPPLRERQGDIGLLAQHFAKLAGLQINGQNCQLSSDALRRLESYQWPGNIRQLQNLIFRSAAVSSKNILSAEDLSFNITKTKSSTLSPETENEVTDLKSALCDYERNLLSRMFELYPSTRSLANKLNVSHNTVAIKLRKYGLR